jgi:hypothetical protein
MCSCLQQPSWNLDRGQRQPGGTISLLPVQRHAAEDFPGEFAPLSGTSSLILIISENV